jgi:uncharacterized protein (UPF0548 family)
MPAVDAPRWSLRAPRTSAIEAFLEQQKALRFSYTDVGATRNNITEPAGYNLDHNRVQLGCGEAVFARACEALRGWRMFPAPWTRITPASASIREGQVVAMQAHALGLWWLNACRIVYVIEETAPVRRLGFAYGTLLAHVEQGEERFTVELHANGEVWYDLRAFSRPRYWPVRLGQPLARRLQWRFVRDSQRAMLRAAGTEAQA